LAKIPEIGIVRFEEDRKKDRERGED